MLKISNLALRRGTQDLFHSADIAVFPGQILGIVGANGCGKSTLLAAILGELEPDDGQITYPAGWVLSHVEQESPSVNRSAIDYVVDGDLELRRLEASEQSLINAGKTLELAEIHDQIHAIGGYAATARAGQMLDGLGFSATEQQQPVNEFSGGWRMRLNLARALMRRADMLLLDEPTNHLDLPAILWLEYWLKRHPGVALVISHDRDFLNGVCTHIAHIERNEIHRYSGGYDDFERLRAERLSEQQSSYEKQQRDIAHMEAFVNRFRAKASKAKQAQSRLKTLERMVRLAPAHQDSPYRFQFQEPLRKLTHLLRLDQVEIGYDHVLVDDINLSLMTDDRIGILGMNGAGKSTLIKAIADGATLLGGERSAHKDCAIGYFAQHQLDQLKSGLSAIDHLREFAPKTEEQKLRDFLGGFGFAGDRIFEPVEPFSGGEKARLVLALILYQKPNLLLLDEPTNHLDLEMRHALGIALQDFPGAVILVAHDRHLMRSVCSEFYRVHNGQFSRYNEDLDAYSKWLLARQKGMPEAIEQAPDEPDAPVESSGPSAKQVRQERAKIREQLKPLSRKLKDIENSLTRRRGKLQDLEKLLVSGDLYQDESRRDELADMLRQQGQLTQSIEELEEDWLEVSETLETAQQQL